MKPVHGKSQSGGAYTRWRSMRQRCHNPNKSNYAYYGGAGITICERWNLFANFLADMGEPPPGTVLDRIDNAKGYGPENCQWVTPKESTANRRNTVLIDGKRVNDLAAIHGLPRNTIYRRHAKGYPPALIVSQEKFKPGHIGPQPVFRNST